MVCYSRARRRSCPIVDSISGVLQHPATFNLLHSSLAVLLSHTRYSILRMRPSIHTCSQDESLCASRTEPGSPFPLVEDQSLYVASPSISNPAKSPVGCHLSPRRALASYPRQCSSTSTYSTFRRKLGYLCVLSIGPRIEYAVRLTHRPFSNCVANSVQLLTTKTNRRFLTMSPALQPPN